MASETCVNAPLPVTVLTLEEFVTMEKDEMKELSTKLESCVTQRIHSLLRLLDYTEDEFEETTNEILYEGMEIYENSEEQSDNIIELNKLKDVYCDLVEHERCALLLYAPMSATPKRKVTQEEDIIARQKQYEEFCQIYPGFSSNPEKNPYIMVDVRIYAEMKARINQFLTEKAMQSKEVLIVFNGHGEEIGILLEDEPAPVHLDFVIQDIKDMVNKARQELYSTVQLQLPQIYKMILANCFSHCFGGPCQDGMFNIIPLTNEDKPTSIFTIKRSPLDGQITGSRNRGLYTYAKNVRGMELGMAEDKPTPSENSMVFSTLEDAEPMDMDT